MSGNGRTAELPRRGFVQTLLTRLRTLTTFERVSLALFGVILLLAAIGPLIAPHPTEDPNAAIRLQPPSMSHPMGTDENGLDIFSRILAAPRTDVVIALLATLLSVAIGLPLGLLAGYFEGSRMRLASIAGEGLMRLLDVIQAFPVFVFAMVLVAIRGPSTANLIAAIAFVNIPVFVRLERAEVLSLREQPFAEAAKAVGNSDLRLAFRHLMPNALPAIIVQVSVTIGFAILLTAGLSFVGAGIAPPRPELGSMISTGARYIVSGQWWPAAFPGLALGALVFISAAVGEALGRLLQPGATPISADELTLGIGLSGHSAVRDAAILTEEVK